MYVLDFQSDIYSTKGLGITETEENNDWASLGTGPESSRMSFPFSCGVETLRLSLVDLQT